MPCFMILFPLILTGMYYLRTKAAARPIQFTVDKSKLLVGNPNQNGQFENGNAENGIESEQPKVATSDKPNKTEEEEYAAMVCSLQNPGNCDMCGA